MMTDIKKGDVVRLKSGGPLMTVQNLGDYPPMQDGMLCVWFENNQPQEQVYDRAVLEISDNSVQVARIGRA